MIDFFISLKSCFFSHRLVWRVELFLPLAIQIYAKQLQFEDFYKIKYLELDLHILDLRYPYTTTISILD